MHGVSLFCKVHLPLGLRDYSTGDIGAGTVFFNEEANQRVVNKLADLCYLPTNKIMLSLVEKHKGRFNLSYSISGTTLQLLMQYRPDVIKSFRQLAATGCVEFLGETYYNSLSWLHSKKEFKFQVEKHRDLIKTLFNQEPAVFRNTELIYNNELAAFLAGMGFRGVICEGLDRLLLGRNPNKVYSAPGVPDFGILLRQVSLSDDIAFRFGSPHWSEFPLTAEKYAGWIHEHREATAINILLDYETFGIHKKPDTGIFQFLENLPAEILKDREWSFMTASQALSAGVADDVYDIEETISWKDKEIESCVWCENTHQNNMLKKIYSLENMVQKHGNGEDLDNWRQLQTADYFYYMWGNKRTDDDAYQYLNPFISGEEAYNNYRNIITGFEIKLIEKGLSAFKEKNPASSNSSIY